MKSLHSTKREVRSQEEKIAAVKDMENCFGFDVMIFYYY